MKSWHIQSHTLPPDIQINKYDDMNVLLLLQQQTYYNSKVKNTVQKGSFGSLIETMIVFISQIYIPALWNYKWLQVEGVRIEWCVVYRSLALI